MTEVFLYVYLIFSTSAIIRGKLEVGPRVQTLAPSFFHKNSNPSKNFKTMLLLTTNSGENFGKSGPYLGVQRPPIKGHFMDTESIRKTFNF